MVFMLESLFYGYATILTMLMFTLSIGCGFFPLANLCIIRWDYSCIEDIRKSNQT